MSTHSSVAYKSEHCSLPGPPFPQHQYQCTRLQQPIPARHVHIYQLDDEQSHIMSNTGQQGSGGASSSANSLNSSSGRNPQVRTPERRYYAPNVLAALGIRGPIQGVRYYEVERERQASSSGTRTTTTSTNSVDRSSRTVQVADNRLPAGFPTRSAPMSVGILPMFGVRGQTMSEQYMRDNVRITRFV